jgi:GrpB-like predicted nucleotidyltransferase (UPF0157 family)
MEEGTVLVVPYDPKWPAQYEAERTKVIQALGDMIAGIAHFGSTAIPGLAAKPTIDILVLVEQLQPAEVYATPLHSLGYIPQAFPGDAPDHVLLRKGNPRTHHLHIVPQGSYERRRHLAFRDYLRTHPETAHAYAEIKSRLAHRYPSDRAAYSHAKTDFVRAIEALVLQERPQNTGQGGAAGDRD